MAEWRNWQTQRTQNPSKFTLREGSTPSSATNRLNHEAILSPTQILSNTFQPWGVAKSFGQIKTFVNNDSGQTETVNKGNGILACFSCFIDSRS